MKKLVLAGLCGLATIAYTQTSVDPLDIREYNSITKEVEGAANAGSITRLQVTFTPGYSWGDDFHTWSSALGLAFFGPTGGRGTLSFSGKYSEKRLSAGGGQTQTHSLTGFYQINDPAPKAIVGRIHGLYVSTPGGATVKGIGVILSSPLVEATKANLVGISGDATVTYLDVNKPGGATASGATLDLGLTFEPIWASRFEVGYTLPSKVQGDYSYFVRMTRSFGPINQKNADEWLGRFTLKKDAVFVVEAIFKFKY